MGEHGKPLTKAHYMTVRRPDHPLAWGDGRVRVHRMVLYDNIGPGPHPCHWCGTVVDWFGTPMLATDHVDSNTWNNDPANLVPACTPCNSSRRLREATTCSRGHEWNEENTYWRQNSGGRGPSRMCRACSRERGRVRVEPPRPGRIRKPPRPKRVALNAAGLTIAGVREWLESVAHLPETTGVVIAHPRAEKEVDAA